jgi:hypothetical protein
MLTARLHPHPFKSGRQLYSVIFQGKLLVDRSGDPECDAARALLVQGFTGKLTLCDGKTGIPRTIIDIEKAARLRVVETANAPRFRRHETCAEGSLRSETDEDEGEGQVSVA